MQEEFQVIRGTKINTVSNQIDSNKSVLLVHGYAEHIMRYENFMHQLSQAGFRWKGYDCKGHGKSAGNRAIISSFEEYVDDLQEVAEGFFIKGAPNYIFAHSMGGLVTLLYLQKYGSELLNGVVFTGAALKMYDKTPYLLEKVAPLIAKVWPSFPAASVDGNTVSRDPKVVEDYNNDPLNYRKKTKAKMGYEFLQAQKKAFSQLGDIRVPMMIHHGSEDRLIHPDSASMIYNTISSADKDIKIWDGLYHELLNEPEKKLVGKEIIQWMNDRSSK